jgi:DNA polymerase-3 subunit gamma/tau
MSYLVLARKWRPRTFDEVVGQATVTRTLKNALASGRIGHAFLFAGARGVGKTSAARILAKALNCSRGDGPTPDPCGECPSCVEIAAGTSLDVQEIDGATHNGVEQVRELRESARYNPARDRFKVWIIDEVHMLSTGAFNALLKTLEEPPPRVKFIFATTEYHKIPDTILSRCQQYEFRMIPARELAAHLRRVADGEGVRISDESLGRIARAAEGSVRDALSLLDQVLSFSGTEVRDEDISALLGLIDRELLLAATQAVVQEDSLAALDLVERLSDYGADYRNFARALLLHFRELLFLRLAPEGSALLAGMLPEEKERMRPVAVALSEDDLLRGIDVLTRTETDLRWSQDPRVTLELALLKLVQMRRLMPFAELVRKVERLAGRPATAPAAERPGQAAPAERAVTPPSAVTPPATAPTTADGVLSAMRSRCRPSVAQSLRDARAREEGDTLVVEVPADFAVFASAHAQEYQELARAATGKPLKVRIVATAPAAPAPPEDPAERRRQQLMADVSRDPAVQEALDLFGGRVVDVRDSER